MSMKINKLNTKLSSLRSSALVRGLEVRLMVHEYENLIKLGCMYCGKELLSENGYCLDRVNPNKGYTLDNVTPCCKICNRAKSDMTVEEFVEWSDRVVKFRQDKFKEIEELEKTLHLSQYTYQDYKKVHKETAHSR